MKERKKEAMKKGRNHVRKGGGREEGFVITEMHPET